ncbi:helix-turn-helix domain-containing protein [Deinococcus sp. HMF7604]|uniref:helix-turn-helix domain-containing protein n=1 Tax=Deinococcus betulae TaxID=2873312 RepID=UPI001CCEB3C1|nr:helix-turn-helix domain-containing protein [Deinococcus betulae]
MSAHATVWAWNQKAGKAKAVLVALANFADAHGVCRVPQTHLAAMTEGSVKTVQRHLQQLEDSGLIARTKHWDDEGRQELDEIQLCGFRPAFTPGKRRVSGGDNLTPYREKPGDILTPIEQDPYSLLSSTFSTNNNGAGELEAGPDLTQVSPGGVGEGPEQPQAGQAPDGAASGEAQMVSPSQDQSKNAHHNGDNVNADGLKQVPPAAARSPYRAAMDSISAAGLLPVWRDWVRLNRLAQVTQEAQVLVWAEWIGAGQAEVLRHNAVDLIQSGSFSHPWGALRKRMQFDPNAGQNGQTTATPERPTLAVGQRVRYPDGSEATVLAVLSRGIATDHPDFPDVPLGQVKTLEVLS